MERNRDWADFLREIAEDIERTYRHAPPVVELRGWWWKKHIHHYQKMRNVVQSVVESQWEMNHEEVRMLFEREEKRERNEFIRGMRDY